MNKNELLFTSNKLKMLAAEHKEVCEEYQHLQGALVEKAIQVGVPRCTFGDSHTPHARALMLYFDRIQVHSNLAF